MLPNVGEDLISPPATGKPSRIWVYSQATLPQSLGAVPVYQLWVVTSIDALWRSGGSSPGLGFQLLTPSVSTGIAFVFFPFSTTQTTGQWRGWLPMYSGDSLFAYGPSGAIVDFAVNGLIFPNTA